MFAHTGLDKSIEDEVYVAEMPKKQLILGGINDFSDSADFYGEYTRFCHEPHEPKLNLAYPIGGYWGNMDDFIHKPSLPTQFFSLDPNG
jgi:hypothetical protein